MNHGFLSCKHKTLESVAPWDSSVAVSHMQKLIPKGKGLRETTIRSMNHQSYSPVVKHFAWLWWSPTASEALWSKLKSFPRGACAQTLLESCTRDNILRVRGLETAPDTTKVPKTIIVMPCCAGKSRQPNSTKTFCYV